MATRRISDKQWRDLEPRIRELFRQGVPLTCKDRRRQTISQALQEEYGLAVTVPQLEAKLKEWGVAKKLRLSEWKTVIPQLDELESRGIKHQLWLAGQEIKKKTIERARRELKKKQTANKSQADVCLEAKRGSQVRQISIMIPGADNQWVPYPATEVGISRDPGFPSTLDHDEDIGMEDSGVFGGPSVDAPGPPSRSAHSHTSPVRLSPNLNALIAGQLFPHPATGVVVSRGPGFSLTLGQDEDIGIEVGGIFGSEVDAPGPASPPASVQTSLVRFSPNLNAPADGLSSEEHWQDDTAISEGANPAGSGAFGSIEWNDHLG